MKKLIAQALFFISLSILPAFVNADEGMQNEQKIYVQPEKVMVMPDGIFYINEVGDFCPVSMISCDSGGVFVVANDVCSICGLQYRHAAWCPYGRLPENHIKG